MFMRTILKTFLLITGLFLAGIISAQEKTITGTITDESGEVLPGTYVEVKGTQNSTETDVNGNYEIQAQSGDTLVFSFIGLPDIEKTVGDSNSINIQFKEGGNQIDQVVVTGLGISRDEKSLGYSVQEVGGDELTSAQPTSAVAALSGKAAGIQISDPSGNLGGSKRVVIRGVNSVTGNNQPLFVVDGIPMNNESFNTIDTDRGAGGVDYGSMINDINPDDIESVSILKGPAAAIYGSRAANGVVLITTKKGTKKGLGISFNSSVTFNQISLLPDMQDQYGAGGQSTFDQVTINGQTYNIAEYAVDESWGPKYDPNVNVLQWDAFDPEFSNDYLNPRPWVKPEHGVEDFFKTGITYKNTLALSSVTDKNNTRIAVTTENTTGTVPNTSIKKYTLGLNLTQKLSDKLTAKSLINFTNTKGVRPYIGYTDNSVTQKFFQWGQRQLDYNRLKNYKLADGTQRTWNRKAWNDATPNYSDNPYWTVYENAPEDERNRIFGNAGLQYQLNDFITLKGTVYGDTYSLRAKEKTAVGSQAQSYYLERDVDFKEFNYEFLASLVKDLSDSFNLQASLGVNKMTRETKFKEVSTSGGLSIPGIYNLNNSKGPLDLQPNLVTPYTENVDISSVFASASLGYKDFLFLDVTARNDWASALLKDNNSYFYPSAALSWVFSKNINASWLSFGKVRASWAQVGNGVQYIYAAKQTFDIENSFKGEGRESVRRRLYQPDLKAERTNTWELGTDLKFIHNRLGLGFTYYQNTTKDGILPLEISQSSGYKYEILNSAEMENKGVEITFNATPVKSSNFKWDIDVNFAKNENELTYLADGISTYVMGNAPFKVSQVAVVGGPYGAIWGTDYVYDDNGNKVVYINGDGEAEYMSTDRNVNLGSTLPDYNMGIRNSFSYKNFNLGFLIDIQKGGKYFSTSHMWGMFSGMLEETAANGIRENGIVLNGVTGQVSFEDDGSYTVTNTAENEANTSAYTYAIDHYYGPAAQSVFDADYYKLREVTLGYNFTDGFGIFENVRVTAFGRNLLTWGLDNDNIDPETVVNGSGNIQGLEGGLQPPTRSFGFNIQLNF